MVRAIECLAFAMVGASILIACGLVLVAAAIGELSNDRRGGNS